MAKIKDLETLRRYGFEEDEIIELQELRKESDSKVEDFKVSYLIRDTLSLSLQI